MSDSVHTYAGVLLCLKDGRMIGQLRDDKPGIDNPGKVATFGGTVEEGELPIHAAWRELVQEETNLNLLEDDLNLFHEDMAYRELTQGQERRFFYSAEINEHDLEQLEVYEGQGWTYITGHDDPKLIESWRPIIERFEWLRSASS